MWFVYDGVPAHFSCITREFLNNNYINRWIGRGRPIAWPACSPDLNPLDFYLWEFFKSFVYDELLLLLWKYSKIVLWNAACEKMKYSESFWTSSTIRATSKHASIWKEIISSNFYNKNIEYKYKIKYRYKHKIKKCL